MGKYVSDLFFGGFVIILVVMFLRKPGEAVQLLQGGVDAYTGSVAKLSSLT